MGIRRQTSVNRHLGINAGRQRREAQGAVEEAASNVDRRRQVYRDDAVHLGLEPYEVKALQRLRRRKRVAELRDLEWSDARIAIKLGVSVATVRKDIVIINEEKEKK